MDEGFTLSGKAIKRTAKTVREFYRANFDLSADDNRQNAGGRPAVAIVAAKVIGQYDTQKEAWPGRLVYYNSTTTTTTTSGPTSTTSTTFVPKFVPYNPKTGQNCWILIDGSDMRVRVNTVVAALHVGIYTDDLPIVLHSYFDGSPTSQPPSSNCTGKCEFEFDYENNKWSQTESTCSSGCNCVPPTFCPPAGSTCAKVDTFCSTNQYPAECECVNGEHKCECLPPAPCSGSVTWRYIPDLGWRAVSGSCSGDVCVEGTCSSLPEQEFPGNPGTPNGPTNCADVVIPCKCHYPEKATCEGTCTFVWDDVLNDWVYVEKYGACVFNNLPASSSCECPPPSIPGTTCGQSVVTYCGQTGTGGPCLTTTLPPCGGGCLYKWDGTAWVLQSSNCDGCICIPPFGVGEDTCSYQKTGCKPTTTTTPCPNSCTWFCPPDGCPCIIVNDDCELGTECAVCPEVAISPGQTISIRCKTEGARSFYCQIKDNPLDPGPAKICTETPSLPGYTASSFVNLFYWQCLENCGIPCGTSTTTSSTTTSSTTTTSTSTTTTTTSTTTTTPAPINCYQCQDYNNQNQPIGPQYRTCSTVGSSSTGGGGYRICSIYGGPYADNNECLNNCPPITTTTTTSVPTTSSTSIPTTSSTSFTTTNTPIPTTSFTSMTSTGTPIP